MPARFGDDHNLTVTDLKDIVFNRANAEMNAYLDAAGKRSEYDTENQRLRYVAVFCIITDAGLEEEYKRWKTK